VGATVIDCLMMSFNTTLLQLRLLSICYFLKNQKFNTGFLASTVIDFCPLGVTMSTFNFLNLVFFDITTNSIDFNSEGFLHRNSNE